MTELGLTVAGQPRAIMPIYSGSQIIDRRNALNNIKNEIMVETIDYGTIPGTNKPCLFKAGAEKLLSTFGLTPKFIVVEKVEDWDGVNYKDEAFFYYWFKCQLWSGDYLVCEADGSCNSRESRYRWRWVGEADVPAHLDKKKFKTRGGGLSEPGWAIDKSETAGKYGKPQEYWDRFKNAIANGEAKTIKKILGGKEVICWEISSHQYQIPNDDISSQVNTIQKMAQKRAMVAAVLIGVNASEFYTQDVEDLSFDEGSWSTYSESQKPTVVNKPTSQYQAMQPAQSNQSNPASQNLQKSDVQTSGYIESDYTDTPPSPTQYDGVQDGHYDEGADIAQDAQGVPAVIGPPPLPSTPKPKVDPMCLVKENVDFVACTKCQGTVAKATFKLASGSVSEITYNADGRSHPPHCGKGDTGFGPL